MLVINWCRGVAINGAADIVALGSKGLSVPTEPYFTTQPLMRDLIFLLARGSMVPLLPHWTSARDCSLLQKICSARPAVRHLWLSVKGLLNQDNDGQYHKTLFSVAPSVLWGLFIPFYPS